jgi:hypothetical protein
MKIGILCLLLALSGCVRDPFLATSTSVIRNREMNTTPVPADGKTWRLSLPPNYKVSKRETRGQTESLVGHSRYNVGGMPVTISVFAEPWPGSTKLLIVTRDPKEQFVNWERVHGPSDQRLNDTKGFIVIGESNGTVIVFQYSTVVDNVGYTLRCVGSTTMKLSVGKACERAFSDFEPTQG